MYDSNKILEGFKRKFKTLTQEEKLAFLDELGFKYSKKQDNKKNTSKKRVIRLKKKK